MAETDHGLALRGGVIARLLADPANAARVADRVYGKTSPSPIPGWPFQRVEIDDAVADEDSCSIGEERTFFVNEFVKPTDALPDAEAEAFKAVKRIKKALSRTALELQLEPGEEGPVPEVVELFATNSIVRIDDDEPGAYHARVEFSAKTVEEA